MFTNFFNQEEKSFADDLRTYVYKLEFREPKEAGSIPIYRVFNQKGKIIDRTQDPNVSSSVICALCSIFFNTCKGAACISASSIEQ